MISNGSNQCWQLLPVYYKLLVFVQDPLEPVLLFTKPLDPAKLAAAGIVPPGANSELNVTSSRSCGTRGRIGRGGRIIFDRWNPFMHTPIDSGESLYIPPKPQPHMHNRPLIPTATPYNHHHHH